MRNTIKNIVLTAAILSLTASAYASGFSELLNDSVPGAQAGAVRVAGEQKDAAAIDGLLANVEDYLAGRSKGLYEENLKARLKAIDSIWALGEIGSQRVMARLEKFYAASDTVIRLNLVISMGKLGPNPRSISYIRKVAASAQEAGAVRAAAFEMLEELGQNPSISGLVQSKDAGIAKGDIIYSGGIAGRVASWFTPDLPVGHAGIFAGTEIKDGRIYVLIADCVPNNFVPPGVRNIRHWKNFTHQFKYPYYGHRTSKRSPSAAQRENIVKLALELGTKGFRYSDSHASQKGPLEFDCVGYTEHIYEMVGLNPTPDKKETGRGWPLTPLEQFEATKPGFVSQLPYFPQRKTPGYYSRAADILRAGLFGISGDAIEVSAEITPKRAD